MRSFSPAPRLARLVARSAVSLSLSEPVDIKVLGRGAGNDLLPLDCLDVAQVVVVENPHAAGQYVCKKNNCVINILHPDGKL